MVHKAFFRERTQVEIRALERIAVSNIEELILAHLESENDEFVQVETPILPEGAKPVPFNRYGPITRLREFVSVREVMQARLHPYELLREAVNSMQSPTLGFALSPPTIGLDGKPLHLDARPLVVPWKEPFEGARVFAYAHQQNVSIELENPRGTNPAYEGLTLIGRIPSRRRKVDRHKISIRHVNAVPLRKNLPRRVAEVQFYIPFTLRPSEETEKRRYAQLRFGMPGLKTEEVLPVMWADCALLYENMRVESQQLREVKEAGKLVNCYPPSLEFTVVPLVTQFSVDLYKKVRNNTLNYKGKKFTDAETNLALGELARQFKHGRVFFSEKARDGRMADYNWAVES